MKPLRLLCTLAIAAQLTACGGGGGNGDTTTPPDSSTPPATPPPATQKLTLAGKVTDAPIPNAIVTATVGSQTFSTTADASGAYSLDLEIEEAGASDFVTLNAKGVGDQAFVELTSLAGSFESLAAQAGEDKTLSSSENFATQITNVSTAEAVLLKEANGGQPVTSNAALQSLGARVNAQSVLDLATAIKLSVDDSTNYPLPSGQTSVLALVSDATARQQLIDTNYAKSPATFATTQTAVAQDPELAKPLSTSAVPAKLTAVTLSSDEGFSFNVSDRASTYTFAMDGTGMATSQLFDQPITWALEGANIKVTYSQPVDYVSYDTESCNGVVRQVEAHYHSAGVTLNLLSNRAVAITETSDVTYGDCPSLQAKRVTNTTARTILADTDFQPIDGEELKGAAQTLYVYDSAQDDVVADVADLAADGTGTTRLLNKSFTWALDSTGTVVTATFNDSSVASFRSLREFDVVSSDVFYEIATPSRKFVGAGASVYADPEFPLVFTSGTVVGRFYQFGVGDEDVPDTRLKGFRLRVDANGTGAQEYDYIDDQDNVVLVDESVDPYNAFNWTIDSGDLLLSKTYAYTPDPMNGYPGCTLGSTDCGVADVRRIVPIAAVDTPAGTRHYVLEKRQFDYNQPVSAQTYATYLIRFYDSEGGAPASGQSKASLRLGAPRSAVPFAHQAPRR